MNNKLVIVVLVPVLWSLMLLGSPQTIPAPSPLKVGDAAPDFTLNDQNNKPVKLSDLRGKKNVVLAFYVLAFTGG